MRLIIVIFIFLLSGCQTTSAFLGGWGKGMSGKKQTNCVSETRGGKVYTTCEN